MRHRKTEFGSRHTPFEADLVPASARPAARTFERSYLFGVPTPNDTLVWHALSLRRAWSGLQLRLTIGLGNRHAHRFALSVPHRNSSAVGLNTYEKAGLLTVLCRVVVSMGLIAATHANADEAAKYWPHWRGPLGTSAAVHADPPISWSETNNVRWKVALPGKGHSTPVVWGNRMFLTAAIPIGEKLPPRYSGAPGAHDNVPVTHRHQFVALAVDRRNGETIWQTVLGQQLPHEGGHYTGSLASGSPVTDGQHVFAYFGSHGLYCLDVDGELIWKVDLGDMRTKHGHGEGSSPALYGNTLVVNWDHEGDSSLVALDKGTGEPRWRAARNEVTSWASPTIYNHDGRPQVIVSGTTALRGYDLNSGEVIWQCTGLSANIVATPIAADGMVFAASSYEKQAMFAIRLAGAKGDITGTNRVAWSRTRRTPYVPSPLLYKDSLYFLRHYQGILTRVDARTGKETIPAARLGNIRNVYASPIAAADRVYVTDLDGVTMVIRHDDKPEVLALNRLNDVFSASAVAVGRDLYLRGERKLYCIAEE